MRCKNQLFIENKQDYNQSTENTILSSSFN
jgi:hypothetical protein